MKLIYIIILINNHGKEVAKYCKTLEGQIKRALHLSNL